MFNRANSVYILFNSVGNVDNLFNCVDYVDILFNQVVDHLADGKQGDGSGLYTIC